MKRIRPGGASMQECFEFEVAPGPLSAISNRDGYQQFRLRMWKTGSGKGLGTSRVPSVGKGAAPAKPITFATHLTRPADTHIHDPKHVKLAVEGKHGSGVTSMLENWQVLHSFDIDLSLFVKDEQYTTHIPLSSKGTRHGDVAFNVTMTSCPTSQGQKLKHMAAAVLPTLSTPHEAPGAATTAIPQTAGRSSSGDAREAISAGSTSSGRRTIAALQTEPLSGTTTEAVTGTSASAGASGSDTTATTSAAAPTTTTVTTVSTPVAGGAAAVAALGGARQPGLGRHSATPSESSAVSSQPKNATAPVPGQQQRQMGHKSRLETSGRGESGGATTIAAPAVVGTATHMAGSEAMGPSFSSVQTGHGSDSVMAERGSEPCVGSSDYGGSMSTASLTQSTPESRQQHTTTAGPPNLARLEQIPGDHMPGPTPVPHDTPAPTGTSLSTGAKGDSGRSAGGLALPLTTGAGAAGIAGVGGGGGDLRGSHRSGTDLGPGGASIPELPIETPDGAGPFDTPYAGTAADTARGVEGRAREDIGGIAPAVESPPLDSYQAGEHIPGRTGQGAGTTTMGLKGDVPVVPSPSTTTAAVPEAATTITTNTGTAADRTSAPTATAPATIPRTHDTWPPAPPTAVTCTTEGQLVPPSKDKGVLDVAKDVMTHPVTTAATAATNIATTIPAAGVALAAPVLAATGLAPGGGAAAKSDVPAPWPAAATARPGVQTGARHTPQHLEISSDMDVVAAVPDQGTGAVGASGVGRSPVASERGLVGTALHMATHPIQTAGTIASTAVAVPAALTAAAAGKAADSLEPSTPEDMKLGVREHVGLGPSEGRLRVAAEPAGAPGLAITPLHHRHGDDVIKGDGTDLVTVGLSPASVLAASPAGVDAKAASALAIDTTTDTTCAAIGAGESGARGGLGLLSGAAQAPVRAAQAGAEGVTKGVAAALTAPVELAKAAAHGGVDLAAGIINAPVNVAEAATKGAIGLAGAALRAPVEAGAAVTKAGTDTAVAVTTAPVSAAKTVALAVEKAAGTVGRTPARGTEVLAAGAVGVMAAGAGAAAGLVGRGTHGAITAGTTPTTAGLSGTSNVLGSGPGSGVASAFDRTAGDTGTPAQHAFTPHHTFSPAVEAALMDIDSTTTATRPTYSTASKSLTDTPTAATGAIAAVPHISGYESGRQAPAPISAGRDSQTPTVPPVSQSAKPSLGTAALGVAAGAAGVAAGLGAKAASALGAGTHTATDTTVDTTRAAIGAGESGARGGLGLLSGVAQAPVRAAQAGAEGVTKGVAAALTAPAEAGKSAVHGGVGAASALIEAPTNIVEMAAKGAVGATAAALRAPVKVGAAVTKAGVDTAAAVLEAPVTAAKTVALGAERVVGGAVKAPIRAAEAVASGAAGAGATGLGVGLGLAGRAAHGAVDTVSDVVGTAKRVFGAAAPAGDTEAGRVSTVGKVVAAPLAAAPVVLSGAADAATSAAEGVARVAKGPVRLLGELLFGAAMATSTIAGMTLGISSGLSSMLLAFMTSAAETTAKPLTSRLPSTARTLSGQVPGPGYDYGYGYGYRQGDGDRTADSDTTSTSARAALLGTHGAAGNLAAGALAASAVAGAMADKAVEGVQGVVGSVVGRGPHPYQSGAARGGVLNTLASWVQPEMEDAQLRTLLAQQAWEQKGHYDMEPEHEAAEVADRYNRLVGINRSPYRGFYRTLHVPTKRPGARSGMDEVGGPAAAVATLPALALAAPAMAGGALRTAGGLAEDAADLVARPVRSTARASTSLLGAMWDWILDTAPWLLVTAASALWAVLAAVASVLGATTVAAFSTGAAALSTALAVGLVLARLVAWLTRSAVMNLAGVVLEAASHTAGWIGNAESGTQQGLFTPVPDATRHLLLPSAAAALVAGRRHVPGLHTADAHKALPTTSFLSPSSISTKLAQLPVLMMAGSAATVDWAAWRGRQAMAALLVALRVPLPRPRGYVKV